MLPRIRSSLLQNLKPLHLPNQANQANQERLKEADPHSHSNHEKNQGNGDFKPFRKPGGQDGQKQTQGEDKPLLPLVPPQTPQTPKLESSHPILEIIGLFQEQRNHILTWFGRGIYKKVKQNQQRQGKSLLGLMLDDKAE